jgi:hypothetical protein
MLAVRTAVSAPSNLPADSDFSASGRVKFALCAELAVLGRLGEASVPNCQLKIKFP